MQQSPPAMFSSFDRSNVRPHPSNNSRLPASSSAWPQARSDARPQNSNSSRTEITNSVRIPISNNSRPQVSMSSRTQISSDSKPQVPSSSRPQVDYNPRPQVPNSPRSQVSNNSRPQNFDTFGSQGSNTSRPYDFNTPSPQTYNNPKSFDFNDPSPQSYDSIQPFDFRNPTSQTSVSSWSPFSNNPGPQAFNDAKPRASNDFRTEAFSDSSPQTPVTSRPQTSSDSRPHTPKTLRVPGSELQLPFRTPLSSPPKVQSPFATSMQNAPPAPYFHSRRKGKGEVEKPWLKKKDARQPWVSWIPFIGIVIGLGLSGLIVWDGMRSTKMPEYCPVLDEDFTGGFNDKIWTKEAEVGGYGNGQFEETTVTEENVFVKDGMLIIKPTLQDAKLIENDSVVNLTAQGICTAGQQLWSSCVTSTNTTNGTIVNPVKSGRVNSKKGPSIKYGRVEVQAQMPTGDWLWPAVWLLPVNDRYGGWPTSGEIDIAESRGNNWTYSMGGNNIVSSALHWGPDATNDAWWRTNSRQQALHTTYSSGFHTYGLIWTPKYLYTYIDTQLLQVLYTKFSQPMWQRGDFPLADQNGTTYVDPWSQTGQPSTPFDQAFYLILNVGVGGSNGWFQDGKGGKPWVNKSPSARSDFWKAKDQWYPTWQGDGKKNSNQAFGEMRIKSVKMWQQKGYGGC